MPLLQIFQVMNGLFSKVIGYRRTPERNNQLLLNGLNRNPSVSFTYLKRGPSVLQFAILFLREFCCVLYQVMFRIFNPNCNYNYFFIDIPIFVLSVTRITAQQNDANANTELTIIPSDVPQIAPRLQMILSLMQLIWNCFPNTLDD